jgi:hypothetical protein
MFAQAITVVTSFTQPVIISKRLADGTVEAGCATFVIINRDGWILTAAHILQELFVAQQHRTERSQYETKIQEINSDPRLTLKQKNKRISRLPRNPKWITNHSYWWGTDGVRATQISVDKLADLAIARLDPFDPNAISTYPTFKNPNSQLQTGTSLCRLGFPLHKVSSTFDPGTGNFQVAPGVLPLPRFPLDGIHTRVAIVQDQNTNRQTKFIETSSPGLRGQSGGPIFDRDGLVWAIQSRTVHFALGFNPKIKQGNKEIEEHQFLSVGLGAHVEEIVRLLTQHNVSFALSP